MSADAQVVIAGAGIAGLSLAGLLARQGITVLLVDRAPMPRDRVCGEGLMPLGMNALRELGIDPASLPGHAFNGLEFHTAGQCHAIPFAGGSGRGIRRTVLLRALAEWAADAAVREARDQVLAPVVEGGRVRGLRGGRGIYRGEVVVAADGAHSPLMRSLGVRFRDRGERMALRQHFAFPDSHGLDRVTIGLFSPYDVYVTPVGERELVATTMCGRNAYQAIVRGYPDWLRATPFALLFRNAEPASPMLGWRQPLVRPDRFAQAGVLAIGDAGGGIDPCLGMGMSFALSSAREAANAITQVLGGAIPRERAEEDFHRWRAALFDHYALMDTLFRTLVTSRAGSGMLVWSMRHWPGAAEEITRMVSRFQPWRSFRWSLLARPVWGKR
jgi:flavin-dependent dehydrogenase